MRRFGFPELAEPLAESLEGFRKLTKERQDRRNEAARKRKAEQDPPREAEGAVEGSRPEEEAPAEGTAGAAGATGAEGLAGDVGPEGAEEAEGAAAQEAAEEAEVEAAEEATADVGAVPEVAGVA